MTSVRRVIIGHRADGKTAVVADDEVTPVTASLLPGLAINRVWELDTVATPVTTPEAGAPKPVFYPAPGGVRFGTLTIPPGVTYIPDEGTDLAAGAAELEAKLPGAAAHFLPDQPGVHVTQTVDYIVVLSGRGSMRYDDIDVELDTGDVLVQNATPHAWFNDGDAPFVLAFALVGASAD